MGSSGGGGSTTTVQKADPWEGLQPYLEGVGGEPIYEYNEVPYSNGGGKGGLGRSGTRTERTIVGYKDGDVQGIFPESNRIYQDSLQGGYQGDVAAYQNSAIQDAEKARLERATQGSAFTDAAKEQQLKTINGDYLNGDKFMDGYGEQILSSVNSQFGGSGQRSGSAYHARAGNDSLGRTAAQLYGQERALQEGASARAPQFEAVDYQNLDQASIAAQNLQAYDQSNLDAARANANYSYDRERQLLADHNATLTGQNFGGTNTSETPQYKNTGAGILGGAASGAGIASSLGLGAASPWGIGLAAGGALLGGIL